MKYRFFSFALVFFLWLEGAGGVTITFDFSSDTGGFFAPASDARASLLAAGSVYESLLIDNLSAIDASLPTDSWIPRYEHPETGVFVDGPTDLFVAADSIIIYVGARDLGGTIIGQAGFGGFQNAFGSAAFTDALQNRGQGDTTSSSATDFGRWGGSLAVDVDSVWNLDHTIAPSAGENDLYSLILHELGHVFGYGTAPSFDNLINTTPDPDTFTGTESVAEHGGEVDIDADGVHWAEATGSTVYNGGPAQESAYDPSLTVGTRKELTDLDVAALDDFGWEIAPVPEPSSALLAVLALGLLGCGRRKRACERR